MTATERYAIVPARAAAEFPRLPDEVRALLKLCDGTRTIELICKTSGLGDRAQAVVARLERLGVISPLAQPHERPRRLTPQGVSWVQSELAEPPPPRAFNDQEEQFFSSSIEHLVGDPWE
jgi:hypothetical protein